MRFGLFVCALILLDSQINLLVVTLIDVPALLQRHVAREQPPLLARLFLLVRLRLFDRPVPGLLDLDFAHANDFSTPTDNASFFDHTVYQRLGGSRDLVELRRAVDDRFLMTRLICSLRFLQRRGIVFEQRTLHAVDNTGIWLEL